MKHMLEVKSITKSFKDYSSEFKRILSWFGFGFQPVQEHKILNNISFSLFAGEAVGIVGKNGAGKSTLLKIITGTLKPLEGSVHVDGRISAILELGMGFHPDLTGRQNAYHSAGLMGYTVAQIDAVIEDIETFAEVAEYFDQPVRTYSSGMQMRVAFAVVTAYRPEVLIVDEALSVGDAYFQHKSFARIKAFREQGTALLLVSHDHGAIQAICDRAVLLEQGSILKDGNPEEVLDFYNVLISKQEETKLDEVQLKQGKVQITSGSGDAVVSRIGLCNEAGQEIQKVLVGSKVELHIEVQVLRDVSELVFGYMVKDRLGQAMYGETSLHHGIAHESLAAGQTIEFKVKFFANLGVGSYSIATALARGASHIEGNMEWKDLSLLFDVINGKEKHFLGLAWLKSEMVSKVIG